MISQRLDRFPDLGIGDQGLDTATDTIVRLALGHVMQPAADPSRTADHPAWMVSRVLGGPGAVGQPG